jgi:predicted dehydrogenase
MSFPGGGQATFTCSTRAEDSQGVLIIGTGGRLEIDIPFNIPPTFDTRIRVTAGGDPPIGPATEAIVFPPSNQYTIQAELFASAILDDTPVPVDPVDAINNMAVIDAVLA